jgi:hypothetical protein
MICGDDEKKVLPGTENDLDRVMAIKIITEYCEGACQGSSFLATHG